MLIVAIVYLAIAYVQQQKSHVRSMSSSTTSKVHPGLRLSSPL